MMIPYEKNLAHKLNRRGETMSYEYELEKARTQQAGHNSPESQYLITDFDTWVANPFWDGVKEMDLSEPVPEEEQEEERKFSFAVCDCESPHFLGSQISCRGLNGENATGIYASGDDLPF